MPFTYELLHLHPILLLCMLIVVFTTAGFFGTYFFRKYIRIRISESHNDVAGNTFAMVGGFYGLLLAFVVFLVWDQFNDAQQSTDIEGSLAKGLYRDIKFYPVSDTGGVGSNDIKILTFAFVNYVQDVLREDSLLDADGPTSPNYIFHRDTITVRSFNQVFEIMERMHDVETYKNQRIDQMFRHLNELATYRSLRGLAVDSEIDIYIWIPLWLGGLITAIFAVLMNIENRRLHCVMNGLLGAFVALIFYIIILSDHPFAGKMRIDMKKSMGKIVEWEKGGMMEKKFRNPKSDEDTDKQSS